MFTAKSLSIQLLTRLSQEKDLACSSRTQLVEWSLLLLDTYANREYMIIETVRDSKSLA